MIEQQKETLSALFDGETNEFETRRILQELGDESPHVWMRYQLVRDVVQGKLPEDGLGICVRDGVAAAIAAEPEMPGATSRKAWLKPIGGFAAAASVGFFAVMAVLQFNQQPSSRIDGFVANGNVSVSQLPINANVGNSASGLNTVSGSVQASSLQQEIEAIDAQKLRERERLKIYLQQHAQHASFNNGRGLIPMARMAEEEN